ncbi:NAC domain-containing protein 68-like [Oryza brachyantha]|uniref:Hypothetical_protein n=1 Tax=Oryza brachyantha TaxID=4533 RepID=G2XMG5_ORYBR|nr:NAC domain-containing protein 68-like [Oryza brachyantha]CBX25359.1 hypothetical_protein [Oryza brachyantha]
MADVNVPSGYRFSPTPVELIRDYLNPWIVGRPIEELRDIVRRGDVYGSDPAKLTEEHKEYGHGGNWYFLSIAKWKGRRGAGGRGRTNRCVVGGGTWHHSQRRRAIIGYGERQVFEYRSADKKKTDWLMEEIESNLPAATTDEGLMVICKLYLTPRTKADEEEEEEEEERQETHDVVVGSKKPRRENHHGFPQEATSYDAPATLQLEAGCSNAGAGGETSQATAAMMDYCPTMMHTSDDSSIALYGHIDINAEGDLVYLDYSDGGIDTRPAMPSAMQSSDGAMTCFAPNPMHDSHGVASRDQEAIQEGEMPLATQSSDGAMTCFAPMQGQEDNAATDEEFWNGLLDGIGTDDPNPNGGGELG